MFSEKLNFFRSPFLSPDSFSVFSVFFFPYPVLCTFLVNIPLVEGNCTYGRLDAEGEMSAVLLVHCTAIKEEIKEENMDTEDPLSVTIQQGKL